MNIQHKSGGTKGKFFVEEDDERIAYLTYSKMDDTGMILSYVEVIEERRGEDIGKHLVEHVVQYARQKGLKVMPLCPYIGMVIERDESLQDVLKR